MKDAFKTLLKCCAVLFGVLLLIHRRVIASYLTGSPMLEAPEWHKKMFKHCC